MMVRRKYHFIGNPEISTVKDVEEFTETRLEKTHIEHSKFTRESSNDSYITKSQLGYPIIQNRIIACNQESLGKRNKKRFE